MKALFGERKTPEEMTKEWIKQLKGEMRSVQSNIRRAERDLAKMKRELKAEAKRAKGDKILMEGVKSLAKSVAEQQRSIGRMYTMKTQLNSAILSIKEQAATVKMSKTMARSAQVQAAVGRLVNVSEVQASTRKMAMEMEKMGLIQEMTSDAFDDLMDSDMEEEVEREVDAVVMEVLGSSLADLTTATSDLPAKKTVVEEEEPEETAEEVEFKKRLAALS